MSWTDILDADLQPGKPVKTGTLTALAHNDVANAQKPVFLDVQTSPSVSGSYPGSAQVTLYAYVPEDAKILTIRAALWASSGTAYAKWRISKRTAPSGYVEQEQSSNATAKGAVGGAADKTWTLSGLNSVSGDDLRGQECKVEIFLKGSGSITANLDTHSWVPAHTSVV